MVQEWDAWSPKGLKTLSILVPVSWCCIAADTVQAQQGECTVSEVRNAKYGSRLERPVGPGCGANARDGKRSGPPIVNSLKMFQKPPNRVDRQASERSEAE